MVKAGGLDNIYEHSMRKHINLIFAGDDDHLQMLAVAKQSRRGGPENHRLCFRALKRVREMGVPERAEQAPTPLQLE